MTRRFGAFRRLHMTAMPNRLSGKVCIITGTDGSIGREAALTFAREGALVVGCGLRVRDAEKTVEAVRAAGGTMVSSQPCDLSKPANCQTLVDLAMHTFGQIDVLFNNAAMAYFNWLEDISDEEWDRNRREEVDLVTRGGNFGWNIMEGTICRPPATSCDMTNLILPINDYDHSAAGAMVHHALNWHIEPGSQPCDVVCIRFTGSVFNTRQRRS